MHIALINAFPNLLSTAEVEFIRRFSIAAERLGHKAYEVVTSDDIHDCAPDFVIATHEFSPKLTPFLTFGAMWSPPAFYAPDPDRRRSILSYDGYLVGSPKVAQFLDDLEFSTGIAKPRTNFRFLPTAPAAPFEPRAAGDLYELVYVGVHWDGGRHGNLFELLSKRTDIAFYGPPANWRGYPDSYRGEVPYDGSSMHRTLARHGVALCLHKTEHRSADTPSMRLFEAAAAGCLIVTDGIPFAKETLGDSAFHLDLEGVPADRVAAQISGIVDWANRNPELAGNMARRSHAILNGDYSLDRTVERTCVFADEARVALTSRCVAGVRFAEAGAGAGGGPLVDVIIRTGGRRIDLLRRAIRSVSGQRFGSFRVILADYKGRADIAALALSESTETTAIDYLRCENNGLRSSTLWAGLRSVTAPYFAMLDDDDQLMPDHFGHLLATAEAQPGHPLYYSGVVRVEEEPLDFMAPPHFQGPLDIAVPETRELKFLDAFDLVRLVAFDNYIQSNAWIARSTCLDETVLVDPKLVVCEDMYLYFLLARHGNFRLSPFPTAYWNWRSASKDNSMNGIEEKVWLGEAIRMEQRLAQQTLPGGWNFTVLRQLTQLLPPPRYTVAKPPARLPLGETQPISGLIADQQRHGLHQAEHDGVWTSGRKGQLAVRLGEPVRDVEVTVTLMAAGIKDRQQAIRVSANGYVLYEGSVSTWRKLQVRRALRVAQATDKLVLTVECAYTVAPADRAGGNDMRHLGVFLDTITCRRVDQIATAQSAVVGQ
ncbi:MAG: glycosyltransferase [Bosea sp.]|nr:glycosyltransferase [Bosea sp. (in: a-proteobacteria)]